MKIWIVRKHPPMPYHSQPGHLEAFTIHGVYPNHAEAANEAKERNKRASKYLFTFAKIDIKWSKQ